MGFCAEKPMFDLLFDLFSDLLSGSPENLLLTHFSTYFNFFGVLGLVGGSLLHKVRSLMGSGA